VQRKHREQWTQPTSDSLHSSTKNAR
jgi:hypothetical protein